MTRRKIARRRAAVAYDVLRGRPVRLDYGYFVVMPLLAAAGGALIGWGLESAVTRSRAAKPDAEATSVTDRRAESVSA
ncbi:hypothetical protein [Actinoplanes awajinensis]|uniref:Uncharacterized protein n=1 Tax=Actinoplanes awajinensis subsp. mycoplanecinus TaxID=135947 RepID=A0A101JJL7_9ACTN|nr:hypothetical protein [Actinoplanes awajinensis]KUL27992.1 hypothetical protein ADL15_32810 [Actinoplanes awajinensis subsp. mycoplanecinus]